MDFYSASSLQQESMDRHDNSNIAEVALSNNHSLTHFARRCVLGLQRIVGDHSSQVMTLCTLDGIQVMYILWTNSSIFAFIF
jgi:hypothetical protein